jgi:hypothetical protein
VAGASVVAIGAAYFMLLGSYLHPLDPGTGTRANVFAGLAYCVLVYAVVATAAELLAGSRPWGPKLTVAVVALIAVGYGVRTSDDASRWRRASTLQHGLLGSIAPELPRLPPRATLLTFNYPADVSPGVPIFDRSWDLNGAVQLEADDRDLRAYPVYRGVAVRCNRDRLTVQGPGSYGIHRRPYGSAWFLNVRTGSGERIRTPQACQRALRRFPKGSLLAGAS